MANPTPNDAPGARAGRLNGWKEIAAYLDRGVRTVQRWEKTLGLPVRRLSTGRGEVVYALTEELDAWREAAERTRDLSERPGERDGEDDAGAGFARAEGQVAGTGAESNGGSGSAAAAMVPAPGAGRAPAPDADPAPPVAQLPAAGARPWRRAAAVLAVAGLAAAGFLAWRAWTVPGSQPADYVMDVDTLRVLDAQGRELWADRFPIPTSKERYDAQRRFERKDLVRIEDLDGDGNREVIAGFGTDRGTEEVRAYNASGKRLFSRVLDKSVRFGDTQYNPPWDLHRITVTAAPGDGRWLWVSWVHGSGEFPCLLERLSLEGSLQSELWTAGHLELVEYAEVQGRASILVGAANNDHKGGSLALFDAMAVVGSMPAETWDKTCRTCPGGGPRKVLVFPRLDLLELVHGFPSVIGLYRQKTGEFRAYVDHGSSRVSERVQFGGVIAYDLSPDLTPTLAEFSAEYRAGHDRHQQAGLLDHPFNDADRAAAWPVLVWENGTWTKVTGKTDK